jgi:hypothetical protein
LKQGVALATEGILLKEAALTGPSAAARPLTGLAADDAFAYQEVRISLVGKAHHQ